jgi:hypothetical protein
MLQKKRLGAIHGWICTIFAHGELSEETGYDGEVECHVIEHGATSSVTVRKWVGLEDHIPVRPIIHESKKHVKIHYFIRIRELAFDDDGDEGSVIHIKEFLCIETGMRGQHSNLGHSVAKPTWTVPAGDRGLAGLYVIEDVMFGLRFSGTWSYMSVLGVAECAVGGWVRKCISGKLNLWTHSKSACMTKLLLVSFRAVTSTE